MNWTIVIPAWGERCLSTFEKSALPAIAAALRHAKADARLLVHTDDRARIAEVAAGRGLALTTLPVPPIEGTHYRLGACHQEAIRMAKRGDVLGFINADMVCSIELFAAAEKRIATGTGMVMMAGTRTDGAALPPVGAPAPDLLRWAMRHPHHSTTECFFGTGRSEMCSNVFFRDGKSVVLRAWHLHPFAAVVDRDLGFNGVTIDCDLPEAYARDEIHVVTDAAEAAFAELSPPERTFGVGARPMDEETVVEWARLYATSPLHEWFFEHRIAIEGDHDQAGDRAICESVLRKRRERRA
jgi:hypothetical protein